MPCRAYIILMKRMTWLKWEQFSVRPRRLVLVYMKNLFLSHFISYSGSPTAIDACRQYQFFVFSFINGCAVIGLLSCSSSVHGYIVFTASSPAPDLSWNSSYPCIYITLHSSFPKGRGSDALYWNLFVNRPMIDSDTLQLEKKRRQFDALSLDSRAHQSWARAKIVSSVPTCRSSR